MAAHSEAPILAPTTRMQRREVRERRGDWGVQRGREFGCVCARPQAANVVAAEGPYDEFTPNKEWADNVEISRSEDRTAIVVKLDASCDRVVCGMADRAIADIERVWNTTVSAGGHTYSISVDLTNVGEVPFGLEELRGDVHFARCTACNDLEASGRAVIGGKVIELHPYTMHNLIAPHELGHSFGFSHHLKPTESINSYSPAGRVTSWELEKISETYK